MSAMPVPQPVGEGAVPKQPEADLGGGWDLWLLGATTALVVYGLIMVLSASGSLGIGGYGSAYHFVSRQIMGVLLGLAGAVFVMGVHWPHVRRHARAFYVLTTALVWAVQTPLGVSVNGAPRWIDLGPLNVQPSEFAKLGLALVLADHLARNQGFLRDPMVLIMPCLAFVAPLLVGVFLQSDLGTIMLLAGIAFVAFFVAGLEWKWVLAALGAGVAGVVLLIVIEPYRLQRVLTFMTPLKQAETDGYQVVQGWIAMSVGGVLGQGLGKGVGQMGFVPEAHTDMISVVVAEELGVPGWLAIFALHGVLLWRGLKIAAEARTLFDMIVASCFVAVIGAQVVINTGVVGGLLPPKGLVLPFMSYGASAVIAHTVMVAFLLRIGLETHRGAAGEGGARARGPAVVGAHREA